MLFMILVGALVFANFVNYTTMPADLKALRQPLRDHPITVMVAICAIYVILGTAMEELSMILLTVPVFFPLVVAPRLRPGVVRHHHRRRRRDRPDQPAGRHEHVRRQEHAAAHRDARRSSAASTPFVVATVVLLALLVAFPSISLVLPRLMKL